MSRRRARPVGSHVAFTSISRSHYELPIPDNSSYITASLAAVAATAHHRLQQYRRIHQRFRLRMRNLIQHSLFSLLCELRRSDPGSFEQTDGECDSRPNSFTHCGPRNHPQLTHIDFQTLVLLPTSFELIRWSALGQPSARLPSIPKQRPLAQLQRLLKQPVY